jgi:putative membrane-bound dehydrogenase-like protein
MSYLFKALCVVFAVCLTRPSLAQDAPPAAPQKPIRALLVIGGCCHDYANQQKILTEGISARAKVEWTIAYDPDKGTRHVNPVYGKEDWAKGFDVVVHDECTADVKDADVIRRVLEPHRQGLPAVVIHCGMHSYRGERFPNDTPWFQFTGVGSTGHGPQRPIAVTYVDKEHPITKGLEDWTTINEELYNNTKLYETARPLARGKQGRNDFVVAWTNTYNEKARVFATTLGHNNDTVGDARFLDLVTRGLLWSVNKLDDKHFTPVKQPAKQAAAPVDRAAAAKKIASSLKAPEGFELTVFAAPPDVNYPTVVAAAPDGALFVGVDEMGSLGKGAGRGRVLRCVDTDGDGAADEFKVFAKMDHPRGLSWDGATGTLYVLHPPFLTAYTDADGDGVSDTSRVLVKGITNEKIQAQRGADHTTNGIRMGIDGWLYVAMGDFGCVKAVGTDGAELQMHGGGVVRVRTDGSGLEMYTFGQRNIYDVAIDPLMNAFTRDNTNDGDGWDVRLSHIIPTGNYGYPRLFKNFPDEIAKPMLELGGGSPCGSLYVDEPGLPGDSGKMLYTVEWGRNAIMRHPLKPSGAGFEAKEEKWFDLPRGTDIDVDGQGRFYVSSWANGGFDYSGPDVGYVVRLAPKGHKPSPLPDLKKTPAKELVAQLVSPSAVRRMAAQREILARGKKDPATVREIENLVNEADAPEARAAAVFTLKQLVAAGADAFLVEAAKRDGVREIALRALADRPGDGPEALAPFLKALNDPDPRVRLVVAWALGRLAPPETAHVGLPLLADSDPLVRHVAVNSLVRLRAANAGFRAISTSTPDMVRGGARVLQALHDPRVVDGLIERIPTADPAMRRDLYQALCRLAYREADWDAGWWGTRPDTSGPYYKAAEWQETEKIKQFLRGALATESQDVLRTLVLDLKRHKINLPEAAPLVAKLAGTDPSFKQVLVDLLGSARNLSAEEVGLVRAIAVSAEEPAALRARAVRLLARDDNNPAALDATAEALASIIAVEKPAPELASAVQDVTRDGRYGRRAEYFVKLAESDQPERRELGYTVLLNLAREGQNRDQRRGRARETAAEAVSRGWSDPARAASLLRAIARTRAEGYAEKVRQLRQDANGDVAAAAASAAERLGLGNAAASSGTTASAATIGSADVAKVLELVEKEKGDASLGAELFARQACANCHTVRDGEPPKGPYLGDIAARYGRAEIVTSVLKPSDRIAQGFETQFFRTKKGDVVEGFVTRESGDEVEYRDAAGATAVIKKQDVDRRGTREMSVMPEALVSNLTAKEFASLVAYLESLKGN